VRTLSLVALLGACGAGELDRPNPPPVWPIPEVEPTPMLKAPAPPADLGTTDTDAPGADFPTPPEPAPVPTGGTPPAEPVPALPVPAVPAGGAP
jgi:hypothetical protein